MSFPSYYNINRCSGLYTDMYELAMAQAYFKEGGQNIRASFDYFFRKLPYQGGYVIFCGLEDLLKVIENLRFEKEDIIFLKKHGLDENFLSWLENFRFAGTIYSMKEGEIVFPTEPILRVEGNLIEVQLIETLLLNYLNFQSLIATKAARVRYASGDRHLSEFGMRRAQGLGSIDASKASIIGGFDTTSNVYAAKTFALKAIGTMAHSFIQSQSDELTAFRKFAEAHPENCTLLVDTYNTLKSGIPNAIIVAHEMEKSGKRLKAIRLDSGDLSYLSKKARQMLDKEGLQYVEIAVSNQLDELVIKSLLDQKSPIDMFGVGTSIATGQPDAALDGVYKLSQVEGVPKIKLSENIQKVTLPGIKQVYRYKDENGFFMADAVCFLEEETPAIMVHPFDPEKSIELDTSNATPLLNKVMKNGKKMIEDQRPQQVAQYVQERLKELPEEHKRFNNPHIYKIGISENLQHVRNELRKKYKL